ncbi:MAG: amidohydrolase [Candidatus Cloacimonetes bacterium]|nr:amidohydrolase [Candidatus Cloacimonadota bacterium]
MNKILIKGVLLDSVIQDILIEGNLITQTGSNLRAENAKIIDGGNKAALPAFYNMHTHSAMEILRGYADDMALMPWLQDKIWPVEGKMTEEDVYWGTKFACLEMIKSGTVLANDMYWHWHGEARAAQEMGIRMINGFTVLDLLDDSRLPQIQAEVEKVYEASQNYGELVELSLAPHAIYTVSEKTLIWTADYARNHGLRLHIHVAETEHEFLECQKKHGLTPIEYLDKIGILGEDVIAAHMIWLSEHDFELVKKHNLTVVHCPVSNMKLSSGIFKYQEYQKRDIPVCVATDGCSSNNNLDLFEEMKFAALLPKIAGGNPEIAPAAEIYKTTTINPARALGLAAGEVKAGNLADIILIDLENLNLIPQHNLSSNLVYSAHADCVSTTICNGKVLMEERKIPDEKVIVRNFRRVVQALT